jgi:hypothetical protein
MSISMLSFIFVIACDLFEWKWMCVGFFIIYFYICNTIKDPITKRGRLGSHSSGLTLPHFRARTWISNVICHGLSTFFFKFMFSKLRWEAIVCFVDICVIVDHHCWSDAKSCISNTKQLCYKHSWLDEVWMFTLTECSLLILGLKLLGSLLNVISRDIKNLFIPCNNDCGLLIKNDQVNIKSKQYNIMQS